MLLPTYQSLKCYHQFLCNTHESPVLFIVVILCPHLYNCLYLPKLPLTPPYPGHLLWIHILSIYSTTIILVLNPPLEFMCCIMPLSPLNHTSTFTFIKVPIPLSTCIISGLIHAPFSVYMCLHGLLHPCATTPVSIIFSPLSHP